MRSFFIFKIFEELTMAAEGAGDLIRVVALLGAAVVAVPLFKRI